MEPTTESRTEWQNKDLRNQKIVRIKGLVSTLDLAIFSKELPISSTSAHALGDCCQIILQQLDELDYMA